MCVYTHTNTHTYKHTHKHIHTHEHEYTCTRKHTCMHTHTYNTYTHMHACSHTYIYVYTHAHNTHVHKDTHHVMHVHTNLFLKLSSNSMATMLSFTQYVHIYILHGSVGWYQFFISGIWHYKFRVVISISWYLNKQSFKRKITKLALLITV